jgi:hypothetical protein
MNTHISTYLYAYIGSEVELCVSNGDIDRPYLRLSVCVKDEKNEKTENYIKSLVLKKSDSGQLIDTQSGHCLTIAGGVVAAPGALLQLSKCLSLSDNKNSKILKIFKSEILTSNGKQKHKPSPSPTSDPPTASHFPSANPSSPHSYYPSLISTSDNKHRSTPMPSYNPTRHDSTPPLTVPTPKPSAAPSSYVIDPVDHQVFFISKEGNK